MLVGINLTRNSKRSSWRVVISRVVYNLERVCLAKSSKDYVIQVV